jgi:hypothetical protein
MTEGKNHELLAETHNAAIKNIVASIVKPPLEAGGDLTDVMVVMESVLTGVMLVGVRLGGDEAVLDLMVGQVKARLNEIRMSAVKAEGSA